MFSPPISACTFDAAGTIIHLAEPVGNSYHRVASRFGFQSDPEAVGESFRKVWKQTPPPFSEACKIPHSNEKMWWRHLVEEVFSDSGATWESQGSMDQCFESLYEHFESPGTWTTTGETRKALSQISSEHRCVILSNFDSRLIRILKDLDLDIYFEAFFLSCEVGASKPDTKMFESARSYFDLPAENILHIGDDPICDGKGARQAGFQFYSIRENENRLYELFDQLSLA